MMTFYHRETEKSRKNKLNLAKYTEKRIKTAIKI
jgi:hypothetical protein